MPGCWKAGGRSCCPAAIHPPGPIVWCFRQQHRTAGMSRSSTGTSPQLQARRQEGINHASRTIMNNEITYFVSAAGL
eukprot:1157731-Pelagomonas_calceolata.AAC.8